MADPAPTPSRALAMGKTVAKFLVAWFLAWTIPYSSVAGAAHSWIRAALFRVFAGFPALQLAVDRAYWGWVSFLGGAFGLALFFATVFAALGAAVRMLARARIRAGHADFLDRLRAWTLAHPKVTQALLAAPGLLFALWPMWPRGHWYNHKAEYLWGLPLQIVPSLLVAWAIFSLAKKGQRELLAPTMGGGQAPTRFEIGPDEIAFDAVAVTRRTVAMVAAFSAVTLGVPLYIATRPIGDLYHHQYLFYLVLGDVAFAVAGALAFRRASRISVGVDGVHVRGTSRARFFAYRDIESARVNGGDIELVKRGRVALRLQLHGEDAARRDAVLARIHENLARVKEGRGAVAAQLVATSSRDDLARVAHGAADYRMASLTREQLWALVEGPEVEASARKAAAEALVSSAASGDGHERARLRVAADHCAEPNVRVALAELAGGAGDEGDVAAAASRSARAARVV
jgi:hypothetical protein